MSDSKNPKMQYISIPQYAKQLGVSRIAVYKRVKKGLIPAKKVGRNYVIPISHRTEKIQTEIQKEHISIPKLAEELGISRVAVYQKVKKGEIKAKKVGRNFVILKDDAQPQEKSRPIIKIKKFISIPELAKKLGISRIAVYKKVKSGQIKAKKIGRNYSIVAQDICVSANKDATRCEMKPKDYQSIPQLAKEMGVSRFKVYQQVKDGTIKATKVGRNYVVPVEEEKGKDE